MSTKKSKSHENELHEIRVRELCADYNDLNIQEEGIVGYGGRLNIRPKYQREFVYDEKHLNLRAFDDNTKREVYEQQEGFCANPNCKNKGQHFEIEQMEVDNITPWSKGGHTTKDNCQMLCRDCNHRKSNK